MNYAELVDIVAENANTTANKTVTKEVLDLAIEAIKQEVIEGREVRIQGFGKFTSIEVKPRKYRMPNVDVGVVVKKAKRIGKFRVSPKLNEQLELL